MPELQKIISESIVASLTPLNITLDDSDIQDSIAPCKHFEHGDYSCSIAMRLAANLKKPPLAIATKICDVISKSLAPDFTAVNVTKPGFINFTFAPAILEKVLSDIIKTNNDFGKNVSASNSEQPTKPKILLEYISANPTGPLHVGHARGAILGDALARILGTQGLNVDTEYYINNTGRQMQVFALSIWLNWFNEIATENHSPKKTLTYPQNAYQGSYIGDFAKDLATQPEVSQFYVTPNDDWSQLSSEAQLDAAIKALQSALGNQFDTLVKFAEERSMRLIKGELKELDISFNEFFEESKLHTNGEIERVVQELKEKSHCYEDSNGALWFAATKFGDDKDRVLIRANGQPTYFAADVAYHASKLTRGYSHLINIWGADHHGYVARVKAAVSALLDTTGADKAPNDALLDILLVQLVSLTGGKTLSKRAGNILTLTDLREAIKADAMRYFFLSKSYDTSLVVDLDLAIKEGTENPVYYLQYAHARICALFRKYAEDFKKTAPGYDINLDDISLPSVEENSDTDRSMEREIILYLHQFPQVVQRASEDLAPHKIVAYLDRLAAYLHSWYKGYPILKDNNQNSKEMRLAMAMGIRVTLRNGMNLLGIDPPEKM